MNKKPLHRERVQVSLHSSLRARGEEIATRRGQSLSEYLEKLIEEDIRDPRPSLFEPIEQNKPPIESKQATAVGPRDRISRSA